MVCSFGCPHAGLEKADGMGSADFIEKVFLIEQRFVRLPSTVLTPFLGGWASVVLKLA